MTVGEEDVRFEIRGSVGLITLDRPKALNALTLEMFRAIHAQLRLWERDPAVAAVVVRGAGERAFCAGGDVRALYRGILEGTSLPVELFRDEYRLNREIARYPKPYVALIDGVTMGGGAGVSIHGSHRVAGGRTLFAMPETAIGLFPDIGATVFLGRLHGRLGLFAGLTGYRMGPADALWTGIATHHVPSERHEALLEALAEAPWAGGSAAQVVEDVLGRFHEDPGPAPLAERWPALRECFEAASVEGIVAALEAQGGEAARETLKILGRCSPTSLKITFRQLVEGQGLDVEPALVREYRLSQACMAGHDFREGVRALIIDKDNRPDWRPATLDEVTEAVVERHFKEPPAGDLAFEPMG